MLIQFNPGLVLIAILIAFCITGLFAAVRGIGGSIAESTAAKQEVLALFTGEFMPAEKKKRSIEIKKRGMGLHFKLISFTIVLVLLVVVVVSTPLYLMMTQTLRKNMLQGLYDRSTVLLEGLASSARAYLPSGNILELGLLPDQSGALPEARYVTITGYGRDSTNLGDCVWATNDPDILSKIDTNEFYPGISRLTDVLSPRLEEISETLNNRARIMAEELSWSIIDISLFETRLAEILADISEQTGSEPQFSTTNLSGDGNNLYMFYKPVMYRQDADNNYFRGLIRLEVSLDSISENISREITELLVTIVIYAAAALVIGIMGAFVLSTFIISPILKLVSHVEKIRDTEDKSKLTEVDIQFKTMDEIAILGSTINDMTHSLVKAAAAASDLSIGKEIQKKFIPLELDKYGNKQSSGFKDTPNVYFFGYYEGARGVSGDYFDYKDLDGRYYAVIKCDVAGAGVPAALIMIQVATMFLNYFKQWKPDDKGMHIEEVVYQINDFIETLAFKHRFAAFTLCLFDSVTGTVRFCNAGDNSVHLYDASEGRIKIITLPENPAAGVFPNSEVEKRGGYKVQTVTIDKGDILLLYTDGIEESKRIFRNSQFGEILCTEGPAGAKHGNHVCGQEDEEMGPQRIQDIINAVMARKTYTLYKYHNPEGNKTLEFDFSSCEGGVEEVVMAMVSVEKMFRCFKDPGAAAESKVLVDRKIDEFLKAHFLQYRNYCSFTREYHENNAYLYYTHIEEDEQYDDLAILGIKRKSTTSP